MQDDETRKEKKTQISRKITERTKDIVRVNNVYLLD